MKTKVFVTRAEATQRFGFIDAGQLGKWLSRNWPLPKGFKAAVRINGEVYEAKAGEILHSQISRRECVAGECEEGFVYEK